MGAQTLKSQCFRDSTKAKLCTVNPPKYGIPPTLLPQINFPYSLFQCNLPAPLPFRPLIKSYSPFQLLLILFLCLFKKKKLTLLNFLVQNILILISFLFKDYFNSSSAWQFPKKICFCTRKIFNNCLCILTFFSF